MRIDRVEDMDRKIPMSRAEERAMPRVLMEKWRRDNEDELVI